MQIPPLTLGQVTLNVRDLPTMTHYYTHNIGLSVQTQSPQYTILGINGHPLLRLNHTPHFSAQPHQAGLYHTAFLLPTRQALGDFLKRALMQKTAIDGASDHGYSEAIYLHDPEGNGIEIYRDRALTHWDVREDGRIVGKTEPMDAHGVLATAHDEVHSTLPAETTIGHVHLQTHDLSLASNFYQALLGATSKDNRIPQADFLAFGHYHHHIALNTWSPVPLTPYTPALGLAAYQLNVSDHMAFAQMLTHLKQHNMPFSVDDQQIRFTDPSGIPITIGLQA